MADPTSIPEPPKAASGWLELLKKANDYNLVSLIAAGIIAYAYWTSQAKWEKRLDDSEARTRAALVSCASVARDESSKTRAEVRKQAAEVQQTLGAPNTPDGGAR